MVVHDLPAAPRRCVPTLLAISHSRPCVLGAGALVCLLFAGSAPVAAQVKVSAADAKELAAYQLTLEKIERYTALQEALARLAAKDPRLRDRNEVGDGSVDDTELPSINKMTAQLQQMPASYKAAVSASGFSLRESVVIGYVYAISAWGAYLKRTKKPELPPGASEANVQFIVQNGNHPIFKRLIAAMDQQGAADEEEEDKDEKD